MGNRRETADDLKLLSSVGWQQTCGFMRWYHPDNSGAAGKVWSVVCNHPEPRHWRSVHGHVWYVITSRVQQLLDFLIILHVFDVIYYVKFNQQS